MISSPVSASITTKSIFRWAQSVNLIEAAKMEFLVHQDGSRIDGGANELEADRFASVDVA